MIKVLVCEDSLPVSRLLVELINADPELEVVGVAGDGLEALECTRKYQPDIIAMDVQMPRLNGLEATRQIMSEQPTPIILISELLNSEVALSLQALDAGALTVLPKPHGPGHPQHESDRNRLCQNLRLLHDVKLVRRWSATATPKANAPLGPRPARANPTIHPRLVAIGASTGGPSALSALLSKLPPTFRLPILITQHIMPGFTNGLASWLAQTTGRRVIQAVDGLTLEPDSGLVVIAPDNCHLTITPNWQLRFKGRLPSDILVPSVDVMFKSVAQSFGASAIGVLLTGMGKDGAEGMLDLWQTGAYTIAQDEATSVVFGMPKEAIELGAAHKVLPLQLIAGELMRFVNSPR